eukprot:CAMPEP_0184025262 /NCGR_PEP_ID=MMETSP0954-20121128/12684_1 /TAXON_ID=627963 /ORGANISM="Aplanochytrium sp, Strain PBS07" /LENGTH=296 /DNA_ID=CAMNT_0026308969 /DNA_START=79 /DNA_END=969 /DNA_ORIENTATION=-
MVSKRVLVTGANKGVGLGIVRKLLAEVPDSYVLIGSRSVGNGDAALKSLISIDPSYKDRAEVVALDVTSDDSVKQAADFVRDKFSSEGKPLFGLVNNAGVAESFSVDGMEVTLEVNTNGVRRVCSNFLPLLDPKGRIVNISSAAGPMFVAKCSPSVQETFKDPNVTWDFIEGVMDKCKKIALESDPAASFEKAGYGDGQAYGLSKALLNSYTMLLAKEYPAMKINACTPGFIATDLTLKHFGESDSMKTPDEGAIAPLFLLTSDNLEGNGYYYGSDAVRSPLDKYRGPGDPAYTGE